MSLKQQLQDDVKAALRSGDRQRLQTLRMAASAIKQYEIDERRDPDDAAVIGIIEKMIKQRREAHRQYEDAGRAELAAREAEEIGILEAYLPERLDAAAVAAEIDALLQQQQFSGMQDMGRAMGMLKQRLQGRADMAEVSRMLRERLQQR